MCVLKQNFPFDIEVLYLYEVIFHCKLGEMIHEINKLDILYLTRKSCILFGVLDEIEYYRTVKIFQV